MENEHFPFERKEIRDRRLSLILYFGCFLILLMAVLGGVTRLTGSGLSIVEWHLISGILPPLTHDQWQEAFKAYQGSPEYLKINHGMHLEAFKNIFWLEYLHRLGGRFLGLYFLVPLFLAWRHPLLRVSYFPWILGIWLLGAAQGAMGWIMVKSGLIDAPFVNPFKLGLHLLLALTAYGLTLTLALRLFPFKSPYPCSLGFLPNSLLGMFMLTSFYGALTAGYKAGLLYPTFPLMGGRWIPEEAWFYQPWISNFFVNPATLQWIHRLLAIALISGIFILLCTAWKKPLSRFQRYSLGVTGGLALVQGILGVSILLSYVSVGLALFHQAHAFILFSALVVLKEASKRAVTPGRDFPSSHSRKAPPAVER